LERVNLFVIPHNPSKKRSIPTNKPSTQKYISGKDPRKINEMPLIRDNEPENNRQISALDCNSMERLILIAPSNTKYSVRIIVTAHISLPWYVSKIIPALMYKSPSSASR
jgi:hypothetical protein